MTSVLRRPKVGVERRAIKDAGSRYRQEKRRPVRSQSLLLTGRPVREIVRSGRYGEIWRFAAGGACSYSSPSEKLGNSTGRRARRWQPCRPLREMNADTCARCRPMQLHGLHQAALDAGDHPTGNSTKSAPWAVRAGRTPCAWRHLSRARGSSATTTTRCRPRSSPHLQARAGPAPGDQPEQRPVLKSVCSCWTSRLATVTRPP